MTAPGQYQNKPLSPETRGFVRRGKAKKGPMVGDVVVSAEWNTEAYAVDGTQKLPPGRERRLYIRFEKDGKITGYAEVPLDPIAEAIVEMYYPSKWDDTQSESD